MRTLFLAVAGVLVFALVSTSCGDDANDQALIARQLAEQAAAARSETTVGTAVPDPAGSAGAAPAGTAPANTARANTAPAITAPANTVERTGVIVRVVALDNTFRPEVIEVQVGDEVLWENRGLNEHDVLYVQDSAAPFGVEAARFQPGDVYTHVFSEPGEFHYYCSIHGNETVGMVGTVVVSG